jgi:SNF2 family DNA or RNA helicase
VRFFLGNPKTGGYGLTLTAASTVVYYSNNYELEVRLQSEDRCHRIGQYKSVTYIDIVTADTVDEKILTALRGKKKISAEVLGDAWRDWI